MSRERILLVEDQPDLAASLYEGLEDAGFEPDHAADGAEALRLVAAATPPFDALVLDIGLPRIDGREVCRRLRAQGYAAPILMLTALGAADDIVEGLDIGSDDYIVKPVEVRVLAARLRAAIRRHLRLPDASGRVQAAGLLLDTRTLQLRLGNAAPRALSPLQARLLAELLRHAPRVLSREELEDALWAEGERPASDALRSHLYQLRLLLRAGGGPAIRTLGKQGYWLDLAATADPSPGEAA
jgi:DNA-binding response OmpR family regulator